MTTLVLCHGWGFTPAFWEPFLQLIPPTTTILSWNLGYDGAPDTRPLPARASGPLIGIGHSLGFAQLALSSLPFTSLVGLNAFTHLTTHADEDQGVPSRKLDQMSRVLRLNPALMLSQFYEQCGGAQGKIPLDQPLSQRGLTRLTQDLELLKTAECTTTLKARTIPLFIALNNKDPIVPYNFSKNQFESLGEQVKVWTNSAAHHGVCEQQWAIIRDHLGFLGS